MERRPIILAVDDEDNILKLLETNLVIDGYEVITTNDGSLAVDCFDKYKPDLMILDLVMPGISGFEVLKKVREMSNIPVIMLTAMNDVLTIERALVNGADDYVTKPFNIRLLSARVKARIKRTELARMGIAAQ